MKNEEKKETNAPVTPVWWQEVPEAEKAVIRGLVSSVRCLKRSESPQVRQAACKWERSIACFIKFRLQHSRPAGLKTKSGKPKAKISEVTVRAE